MRWLHRLVETLMPAPEASELVCVACGSVEIHELAPEVYDCRVCGHEGGERRAEYAFALWEAAVAGWSDDRRSRECRSRLVAARRHLENALGSFEAANAWVSYATEDGGTSAQDQAYFEGAMHVQQALAQLREATVLDPELALGGVRRVDLQTANLRPYGSSSGPLESLFDLYVNNGHGSLPDLVSSPRLSEVDAVRGTMGGPRWETRSGTTIRHPGMGLARRLQLRRTGRSRLWRRTGGGARDLRRRQHRWLRRVLAFLPRRAVRQRDRRLRRAVR